MTVWAWVSVGSAVILTAVAWSLFRNLTSPRQPPRRPLRRPRTDTAFDAWLVDRYQLSVSDRGTVKDAVLIRGQVPAEPALTEPTRGLASEVASGRLPYARPLSWLGWAVAAVGTAECVVGLVLYFTSRTDRPGAIADVIQGVVFAAGIAPAWILIPRQMRRKARKMLEASTASGRSSLS